MRQIDYFKFLNLFPEIINTSDSIEVKKVLLNEIKKISKIQKEKTKLLPIDTHRRIRVEDFRDNGIEDFYVKITFKKKLIFSAHVIKYKVTNGKKIEILPEVYLQRPDFFRAEKHYIDTFMSNEDIINLKRTILIDNMIK